MPLRLLLAKTSGFKRVSSEDKYGRIPFVNIRQEYRSVVVVASSGKGGVLVASRRSMLCFPSLDHRSLMSITVDAYLQTRCKAIYVPC